MNRRRFVCAAAAGVAALARGRGLRAAQNDLLIRGGRVIDPSLRLDAVGDVAVAGGRITAVGQGIAGDAAEVIDATGRLVVPGLLDIHTHYARDLEGARVGLAGGVTGWIDAGSGGADQIDEMAAVVRSSPQPAAVLINIGRAGILPDGDTMDLRLADVDAATDAVSRHRDVVAGVKVRLTRGVAADDVEVLRRAQEVASSFGLPVMAHIGQTASPLPVLLDQMKPGDIVTHMFAPPPNSILDGEGRIPRGARGASPGRLVRCRQRADGPPPVGYLRCHPRDGFWPDTVSTDGNTTSATAESVIDFPNVLSKFLNLGLPLDEVVGLATVNASRVFPLLRDRGTLNVGAPADIAVLELREGTFQFVDNYGNTRTGSQRLFPAGTVLGGRWVERA